MEREAMEGFVSPESHSNVKKQLMDMKVTKTQTNQTGKNVQARQRELATAFSQVEKCEQLSKKKDEQVLCSPSIPSQYEN